MKKEERFIPTTMKREIYPNIVFRPIRSWHSNIYAGEQKETLPDSEDRSSCMRKIGEYERICNIPHTYTHRLYWNKKNPKNTISAFLSYPDAMSYSDGEYFWETLGTRKNHDIERFFGKNAEKQMEKKIIKVLTK